MKQDLINKMVQAMELEQGNVVLLNFWGEIDEIQDLYGFCTAVASIGAMPMPLIHSTKYYSMLFQAMESNVPEKWYQQFQCADVVIDIMNHAPGMAPANLSDDQCIFFGNYLRGLFGGFTDKKKFIQITMPTDDNACRAGIEPDVFKARTIRAMDIDYAKLKADCKERIQQFIGNIRTVRTGKDCVLTLDTTGRNWIIDAGDGSLPCGEIYIAPIEDGTNGKVFFSRLAVEDVGVFEDVIVEVKGGRIVDSNFEELNEFVKELPEGGDVIAELGIGMNPNVDKTFCDSHLDENAIGTFHIALGMNHLFGGNNRCPIHIDLVGEGIVD